MLNDTNLAMRQGLKSLNCSMSEEQIGQLQAYIQLLVKWNKVYNLTAIRNPADILPLHILDSLAVAPYLSGSRFLDVGSGGGVPGIPLAILHPDWSFTLLDTIGKKTRFMQQAVIELNLPNVIVKQTRVESWSADTPFDAIISRAFASIKDFVNLTQHHLSEQGSLYAMKGRYPADELAELPAGFQLVSEHELAIPELMVDRYLLEMKRFNNITSKASKKRAIHKGNENT